MTSAHPPSIQKYLRMLVLCAIVLGTIFLIVPANSNLTIVGTSNAAPAVVQNTSPSNHNTFAGMRCKKKPSWLPNGHLRQLSDAGAKRSVPCTTRKTSTKQRSNQVIAIPPPIEQIIRVGGDVIRSGVRVGVPVSLLATEYIGPPSWFERIAIAPLERVLNRLVGTNPRPIKCYDCFDTGKLTEMAHRYLERPPGSGHFRWTAQPFEIGTKPCPFCSLGSGPKALTITMTSRVDGTYVLKGQTKSITYTVSGTAIRRSKKIMSPSTLSFKTTDKVPTVRYAAIDPTRA